MLYDYIPSCTVLYSRCLMIFTSIYILYYIVYIYYIVDVYIYMCVCASGTVCIEMLIRIRGDIPFHVARVRRSQPPQVDSYGSSTLHGCRWGKTTALWCRTGWINGGLVPICELWCWYIYLQKSGDFVRANVGKYSSTMEHMGIVNNVQMPVVVGMNLSVFLFFWMYLVTRY
jgi:hypothetical protein